MNSRYKGFTLMEMMISMVVISILMAVSAPLITKFSMLKTGVNQNVTKCINNNISTGWYNTDGQGATILPTTDPCRSAVVDVQNDRNKALSSAISTTEHGSSAQQIMAKKILRTACDQGGAGACDYFINTCWLNGHDVAPYCDDAADYTDITYYLQLNRVTYANSGADYIASQLKTILPKMVTNSDNEKAILEEAKNDITSGTSPNNNIATNLVKPLIYIQACNEGIQDACDYAYANNYNKSCYQVKTNWELAPTQTYKLTYSTNGGTTVNTASVSCDMTTNARAAITGCKNITASLLTNNPPNDDCTVGYNNNYNRSCSQININWPSASTSTYNLTHDGAPPTALVSATCPPPCVASGIGAVCSDGTVYAGDRNGYYYFTTPSDQAPTATVSWETNSNTTLTGANNANDGTSNTNLLVSITNPPNSFAPHAAAAVCSDATDFGYNDWYLPARNEMLVLATNKVAIGNFALPNAYWSSTESGSLTATMVSVNTVSASAGYGKWSAYNVRCVRQQLAVDATCPNPGDTCADGTKYAGPFSTYYLFTTPVDKGQITWNSGSRLGSYTRATDQNYGMPNSIKLISLADHYAPYNAVLTCKALNDVSTSGYTDWYLPSRNEIDILADNRLAIGGFTMGVYYWSSTEYAIESAYARSFTNSDASTIEKYGVYRIRCIRRD